MERKGFKELVVWKKAKDLAVIIYKVSNESALHRDFSLREQIRRSAVSVPSNIAEGDERDTQKEALHFLYIAKGSLAELRTQLQIAYEAGLMETSDYQALDLECEILGKQIGKLIRIRSNARFSRRQFRVPPSPDS